MAGIGKLPKLVKGQWDGFRKNPLNIGKQAENAFNAVGEVFTPDNSAMEALLAEQSKALPMADPEELTKARRRRGARGRGRSSTILSQGNDEGLGG